MLKNCVFHDCQKDGILPSADRFILDHLGQRLVKTLKAIKAAAPGARVILVGYPNIMNPDPGNALRHCPWLSADAVTPLVDTGTDLNTVEQAAAQRAGVGWISLLHALAGHELCTGTSWVRSLTVGGSQNRGHPLIPGQDAMAAKVIAYLTSPHWSHGRLIDSGSSLTAVSCSTSSFCLAVDSSGNVLTYSGGSWSRGFRLDPGGDLTGVSCVSKQFCAATSSGSAAYIRVNGHWSTSHLVGVDGNPANLTAISCPVAGHCVATGDEDSYSYAGGRWAKGLLVQSSFTLRSISCPATSFCLAADAGGNVYGFTGRVWSGPHQLGSGGLSGVSCTSVRFCAVSGTGTVAYVRVSGKWSHSTLTASDGQPANLTAVSCAIADYCLATGDWNSYTFSAGSWARGHLVQNGAFFTSISCPSVGFCMAVDSSGRAYTYQSAA